MDQERLLWGLVESFQKERGANLLAIVRYGRRGEDSDLDLLIVTEDAMPYRDWRLGAIDLLLLGKDEFTDRLLRFDPVVCEPVVTGDILDQKDDFIRKAAKLLGMQLPTRETRIYLKIRGQNQYKAGKEFLFNFDSSLSVFWALLNLDWAFSLMLLAETYEQVTDRVVTIDELRSRDRDLGRIGARVHKAKRNPCELTEEEVSVWFRRWEDRFLFK